jgi:hypothetical protein
MNHIRNIFILGFGNNKLYTKYLLKRFPGDEFIFINEYEKLSNIINKHTSCNIIAFSIGVIWFLEKLDTILELSHKIKQIIFIGTPYKKPFWGSRIILKIFIHLPTFLRRMIYTYFNTKVPECVLQEVLTYPSKNFILLHHLLFEVKVLSKLNELRKNKFAIELIVGENDEYLKYSTSLSTCFDNIKLHTIEGDHHLILNQSNYLCLKLEKMLNIINDC